MYHLYRVDSGLCSDDYIKMNMFGLDTQALVQKRYVVVELSAVEVAGDGCSKIVLLCELLRGEGCTAVDGSGEEN